MGHVAQVFLEQIFHEQLQRKILVPGEALEQCCRVLRGKGVGVKAAIVNTAPESRDHNLFKPAGSQEFEDGGGLRGTKPLE
mmetsp:Transcript_58901/g.105936  ORF Transcript_58901/g.105936 Transcript_58901/m.105936 type:complete len:81 (-) Transcript_58901:86-328(-)